MKAQLSQHQVLLAASTLLTLFAYLILPGAPLAHLWSQSHLAREIAPYAPLAINGVLVALGFSVARQVVLHQLMPEGRYFRQSLSLLWIGAFIAGQACQQLLVAHTPAASSRFLPSTLLLTLEAGALAAAAVLCKSARMRGVVSIGGLILTIGILHQLEQSHTTFSANLLFGLWALPLLVAGFACHQIACRETGTWVLYAYAFAALLSFKLAGVYAHQTHLAAWPVQALSLGLLAVLLLRSRSSLLTTRRGQRPIAH